MAIVGCPMELRSGIIAKPLTLPSTITLRRWHAQWSPASGFTSKRVLVRRLNFLARSNAPPVPPRELIRTFLRPYFGIPRWWTLST
ncbi:hypothetical protein VTO73DRAFT_2411 [Trametes versicolor]